MTDLAGALRLLLWLAFAAFVLWLVHIETVAGC